MKEFTIPQRLDKHEFVYRFVRKNSQEYCLGCHFLNNLAKENQTKIWRHYCGFIVLHGEGSYTDWQGKTVAIGPGWFAQHLPGRYHIIRRNLKEKWLEVSISLGYSLFRGLADMGIIDPERPVFRSKIFPELITELEVFHEELKLAPQRDLSGLLIDVQKIFLKIFKDQMISDTLDSRDRIIEKSCDLLSINFQQQLPVTELAEKFNISYPHFRREFKKRLGTSPGKYRIRKRIEQAKIYLQEGQLNVNEIALRLGYSDQFIFSKQFKKETGVSPTTFRH